MKKIGFQGALLFDESWDGLNTNEEVFQVILREGDWNKRFSERSNSEKKGGRGNNTLSEIHVVQNEGYSV